MAIAKEELLKDGITYVSRPPYERSYIINCTGVTVREVEIDSGKDDGVSIEISMITDSHVRANNDSYAALKSSVAFAGCFDRMVLSGDSIESSSDKNNVAKLKETVFDEYPGSICVMGNHEQFYGDIAANREYVDSVWPHDTVYYSEILKNKVMLIALDNNTGKFYPSQQEPFVRDLEYARANDLCVLVFQHIRYQGLKTEFPENVKMLDIVKSYGDVIKAVFSGHVHVDDRRDIVSEYTDKNGNNASYIIPSYTLAANGEPDFLGNVLIIKVK